VEDIGNWVGVLKCPPVPRCQLVSKGVRRFLGKYPCLQWWDRLCRYPLCEGKKKKN